MVSAYAVSPQLDGVPFTLLGMDAFAEAPFRNYLAGMGAGGFETIAPLLTQPGAVLLSAQTATRYHLRPCPLQAVDDSCRLELVINGESRVAHLAGVLEPTDDFARRALDTLIVTDISTAQSLTGTKGRLTQIDLIFPEGMNLDELSAALPEGATLIDSAARSSQIGEMTAAFQVNLTALSLLALVVGVFLIYNTMAFSVLQRRELLASLRVLGATSRHLLGEILLEAALLGLLGGSLGLALGVLAARAATCSSTRARAPCGRRNRARRGRISRGVA